MRRWSVLAAVAIVMGGQPVLAHDVWIEPSTFSPALGETVGVRLRVGEHLVGDPIAFAPSLVNQFIVQDASSRKPVFGRAGAEPAGLLRVASPGLHIIGYRSNRSRIELAPAKFHDYLKEEGLESIIAARTRRNEADTVARELYSRCAKSLVLSGGSTPEQSDKQLGFTLELIAERNPYALAPGEKLPVRLIYADKPLAGALVIAMNSLNPAERQMARSDRQGRVAFQIRPGGMWLIKTVHMVPAPAGSNAEWESFWASLTFELRGQTTTGGTLGGNAGGNSGRNSGTVRRPG